MRDDQRHDGSPEQSNETSNLTRRNLLRTAGVMAAGGVGGAAFPAEAKPGKAPPFETDVFPNNFPLSDFAPDINLAGMFTVVTGASRGIGRATAEALVNEGVTVIGTSRDAAMVPSPPSFPLLDLDITSDASVDAFQTALTNHPSFPGSIDILINNAGRYIIGTLAPPIPE